MNDFSSSAWIGRKEADACVTGEDRFVGLNGFKAHAAVFAVAVAEDLIAGSFGGGCS